MKHRARIVLTVSAVLLLAVLLLGASPAKTAEASGSNYHVVKWGENLTRIAQWYGVNVWTLACANGLRDANYIYAGMVLYVPYGGWYGGCKPSYPTNGCYTGCYQQKTVYKNPCNYSCYNPCNNTCYNPCNYSCYQPVAYNCQYIVRWGDNLSSIAWRYHTSYTLLAKANKLWNPNYIYAGQRLYIPGCKYV